MLLKIFSFVVVMAVIALCFYSVLLAFRVEKEHEKRFHELLEMEKKYYDLQSQVRKVSIKECDSCNKDL